MLAFLSGTIEAKHFNPNSCEINVNGLGFEVSVSHRTWTSLEIDKDAKLFTSLNISQDNVKIFGFSENWEKRLFDILSSVKGIGSKSALAIVDVINPQQIIQAIREDSGDVLSNAQGIGKKSAERIIFELKPKLDKLESLCNQHLTVDIDSSKINQFSEVADILQSLGYNQSEIDKSIKANAQEADSNTNSNTQEMLKNCITWLNKN
ncbi:MAG: Holliday junction branch migration protein RuvA [Candidatus Caenarcaniphilales bacterium]|nr:Holliday junction branch migration protein RuvA [Candidatus Caenarcaniphilales bacterium]